MTDEAITIMAKAIAEDMGPAYPKFLAKKHAIAALEALCAAGYWVERWRPIEGAGQSGEPFLGFSPDDGQPYPMRWVEYGQDEADEIGASGWLGYTEPLLNDLAGGAARPTHFTPLPLPPVQTEGGDR